MATIPRQMMGLPNSPSFRYKALNPAYQSDPRRILGQQLMQQGSSSAPVQTPLQGLGRLSSALVGAFLQKGAIDRQVDREDERTKEIMGMIPANATPEMRAFAQSNPEAFMAAFGQSIFRPKSEVFTQDLGGGTVYGTQTTGPFGNISQNVSGFASKPKVQPTQIITLINPNDPTDFVTGDENSAEIKAALTSNKYQLPSKSGANINVNTKQETEANKVAAQNGMAQIGELQKEVSSERELIGRLDISMELLKGDTQTGPLTNIITPFKSLGKELGFLNDKQVTELSNIEVLRAAFAYQIPRMRVPGSGATSDFEARLFTQATANMSNTPEANKVLVIGMKKLAERKREILKMKEKYFETNKNLLGFAEFEENNSKPIFNKYDTDQQYDQAIASGELKTGDLFFNGETRTFEIVE